MSRIRTIKPEFWTSEQIMECSPLARLAFIGMWNFCDDNGVHPASCKTLKAQIFPADDLTAADVQSLINELLEQRLLIEFTEENRPWWWVTGWRHQLINRPSKSRFPLPPHHAPTTNGQEPNVQQPASAIHGGLTEDSVNAHGILMERSLTEGKGIGREEEGKGREEESAQAPNAPAPTATPSAPCAEPTPTATATAAAKAKAKAKERAHAHSAKISLPADFAITPELQAWADQKGYGDLNAHLDPFKDKAQAKGYQYTDWNAAFRNAVRDDWAGLRTPAIATATPHNSKPGPFISKQDRIAVQNEATLAEWIRSRGPQLNVIEGECHEVH
jgi:hypothetical protein